MLSLDECSGYSFDRYFPFIDPYRSKFELRVDTFAKTAQIYIWNQDDDILLPAGVRPY